MAADLFNFVQPDEGFYRGSLRGIVGERPAISKAVLTIEPVS